MEHERFVIIDPFRARGESIAAELERAEVSVEHIVSAAEFKPLEHERVVLMVHHGEGRIKEAYDASGQANGWIPIVAYGEHVGTEQVVDAVREGAVDFISLPTPVWEMLQRIDRRVARDRKDFERQHRALDSRRRIETLSPREQQVLDLLSLGGSNKHIARQLGISGRTVEIHRANMIRRLGSPSSADAIRVRIEAKFS